MNFNVLKNFFFKEKKKKSALHCLVGQKKKMVGPRVFSAGPQIVLKMVAV